MSRHWFYLETFVFGGNLSVMAFLAWNWVAALQALMTSSPFSPWSPASMMAIFALFLLQRSLFLSLYSHWTFPGRLSPAKVPDRSEALEPRVREIHLNLFDGVAMLGLFASGLVLPMWLLGLLQARTGWHVAGMNALLTGAILIGIWIVFAVVGYRLIERWFRD